MESVVNLRITFPLLALLTVAPLAHAETAQIRGMSLYYEIHGQPRAGRVPLVLLHGGGSTIDSTWGRVLPIFAAHRRVIALEEQAHGRTSDRDAPLTFESSADDVAALLQVLKVDKADLMGFSNGASVALEVAIRHSGLARKLVFASSMTKRSGAQPQFWEFIGKAGFEDMPQALKDAFLRVNPDPAKLRNMHDKDLARMRNFRDVPDAEVAAIRAPTLVMLGDHDVVRPEHAFELTKLIPGSRLLILPGDHGDYIGEVDATPEGSPWPALTAGLVEAFLDGQ